MYENREPVNESREPAFWPWFISLGSVSGVVGYFASQGEHVIAAALIGTTLSALSGYCLTASRLARWYCGLAVAVPLTLTLGLFFRPTLVAWLGTSGWVLSLVVTAMAVTLATARALRWLIVNRFAARPSWQPFNQWAGFGIGAGQGVVLSMLVLGGLLVLEPMAIDRLGSAAAADDHRLARVVAAKVVEYAGQTKASAIGPAVATSNPFQHWSPLKEWCRDLSEVRNPWTRAPSKSERTIDEHLSAR